MAIQQEQVPQDPFAEKQEVLKSRIAAVRDAITAGIHEQLVGYPEKLDFEGGSVSVLRTEAPVMTFVNRGEGVHVLEEFSPYSRMPLVLIVDREIESQFRPPFEAVVQDAQGGLVGDTEMQYSVSIAGGSQIPFYTGTLKFEELEGLFNQVKKRDWSFTGRNAGGVSLPVALSGVQESEAGEKVDYLGLLVEKYPDNSRLFSSPEFLVSFFPVQLGPETEEAFTASGQLLSYGQAEEMVRAEEQRKLAEEKRAEERRRRVFDPDTVSEDHQVIGALVYMAEEAPELFFDAFWDKREDLADGWQNQKKGYLGEMDFIVDVERKSGEGSGEVKQGKIIMRVNGIVLPKEGAENQHLLVLVKAVNTASRGRLVIECSYTVDTGLQIKAYAERFRLGKRWGEEYIKEEKIDASGFAVPERVAKIVGLLRDKPCKNEEVVASKVKVYKRREGPKNPFAGERGGRRLKVKAGPQFRGRRRRKKK